MKPNSINLSSLRLRSNINWFVLFDRRMLTYAARLSLSLPLPLYLVIVSIFKSEFEFFPWTKWNFSIILHMRIHFAVFFFFSFLKMIRPLMGWAEGSYSFQVVFSSSHISNFWADARRSATKLDEYPRRKNMVNWFWERKKTEEIRRHNSIRNWKNIRDSSLGSFFFVSFTVILTIVFNIHSNWNPGTPFNGR